MVGWGSHNFQKGRFFLYVFLGGGGMMYSSCFGGVFATIHLKAHMGIESKCNELNDSLFIKGFPGLKMHFSSHI